MITVRPVDVNGVLFLLDDLYKQMEENCSEDTKEDFCAIFSTVFNNIKIKATHLPTVRPADWSMRQHGYWKPVSGGIRFECSICEGATRDFMPTFCSNCGAVMEKREQDVLEKLH